MKQSLFLLLICISASHVFAQISNNPRGFTVVDFGETQAADVVEVNDGYIVSIVYDANILGSTASLLKFDFDMNLVDSVILPHISNYINMPPSIEIIGDSIYAHHKYFTFVGQNQVAVTKNDMVTLDFDLNIGNNYHLPLDSFITTHRLLPYTDTTFLASAVNFLTPTPILSIYEVGLNGDVFNRINIVDSSLTTAILSIIPLENNRVLLSSINGEFFYVNTQNAVIDSIIDINDLNFSKFNRPVNLDFLFSFSQKNYGVLLSFETPLSLLEISDSGEIKDVFYLDSNEIVNFTNLSDTSYNFGLVRALDEDLDANIYSISSLDITTRRGFRTDSSFGSVIISKFNSISNHIHWKTSVNIFEVSGDLYPIGPSAIRITSDGGCIAVFYAQAEDSIIFSNGSAGFILRLGPNGELLSQTSFKAPNPQISIYPNPANEYLHINSHQTDVDITISDVSGRVVYQSPSRQQQHQVDVQEWPSGMYVVQMTGKDGKRWTEKVLVE